jgi:microcystin-dependent protein
VTVDGVGAHDHAVNTRTTTSTSHSHGIANRAASAPSPSNANDFIFSDPNGSHSHTGSISAANVGVTPNTASNNPTTATNQFTGSGSAHNNLQPYIVVNYIIKT